VCVGLSKDQSQLNFPVTPLHKKGRERDSGRGVESERVRGADRGRTAPPPLPPYVPQVSKFVHTPVLLRQASIMPP
jgi:hypothetical protein